MKNLIKEYQLKKEQEHRIEALIEIWQKLEDISDLQGKHSISDKEVDQLGKLDALEIHVLRERNSLVGNFSVKDNTSTKTALNIEMN